MKFFNFNKLPKNTLDRSVKSKCLLGVMLFVYLLLGKLAFAVSLDTGYYYRLTNMYLGEGRALDINSTVPNVPFMATTGNYSGQFWQLTPLPYGAGYRLTNRSLGYDRSLEATNTNYGSPNMGNSSNNNGQFWILTPESNGYYRLSSTALGNGYSLDTYGGAENKPFMGVAGNYSGQFWKLTPIEPIPVNENITKKYTSYRMSGFNVYVEKAALSQHYADTTNAMTMLRSQLKQIMCMPLQNKIISRLRSIPVFLDWNIDSNGAMRYDTSRDWLVLNGQMPEKEKSVAIINAINFVGWINLNQPYMVLHEFSHGIHDKFYGFDNSTIKAAYDSAMANNLYASVEYHTGYSTIWKEAYATTNPIEYFAELTEAYLGENDYFPFIKSELQGYDPVGYSLMTSVWLYRTSKTPLPGCK